MARPRTQTLRDVLGKHQFADGDSGGCSARDGFGLYASPPVPDDEQMADHQIEEAVKIDVLIADPEVIAGMLNSALGTDAIHTMFARAFTDRGYGLVRLSEPR